MKYDNIYDILTFISKYDISIKLNDEFEYLKENLPSTFKYDDRLDIQNIQTSSTQFNINMFGKINGKIEIDGKVIDTFVYRSIPIVRDGVVLDRNIEFIISDDIKNYFTEFLKNSEDISPQFENILINILNNEPISFKYIKPIDYDRFKTDLNDISNKLIEITKLEAEVKSLKSFIKNSDIHIDIDDDLLQYFNKDGSLKEKYKPRKKVEPKLKIPKTKIDKLSIPSLNSVLKKVDGGRKLNKGDKLLYNNYLKYKKLHDEQDENLDNEYFEKSNILKSLKEELTFQLVTNKVFNNNIFDTKIINSSLDGENINVIIDNSDDINDIDKLLIKYGVSNDNIKNFIDYISDNSYILSDKDKYELLKILKNIKSEEVGIDL